MQLKADRRMPAREKFRRDPEKMAKVSTKRTVLTVIWFVFCVVLIVGVCVGDYYAMVARSVVSNFFNQSMYAVETDEDDDGDTEYYKSAYSSDDDLLEASMELCADVEAEGMVLMKNDNGLLPLGEGKKVSLFSASSVDIVYGGTGSGQIDTTTVQTLKEAFEEVGYEVNGTLWSFYESAGYSRTTGSQDSYPSTFLINEVSVSKYTSSVLSSFGDYDDAAIVVLSRSGGEGADLVAQTEDGCTTDGEGGNYLALSDEEKDMLALVDEYFDDVIVLVNSANAMQLGDLLDYDSIQSVLWIGGPGQNGLISVAQAFTGEVNPSGRLSDTWAYSALSSPAAANMGMNYYTNGEDLTSEYSAYGSWMGTCLAYQEGIYVGYRYYETRYEDKVLGQGSAGDYDYSETVQYPFGYGLSYSEFEYGNVECDEEDDAYVISVDVKNTSSVAGKETVQVYLQKPYTSYDIENGVEKASVELAGFAKSGVIAAGDTETVEVTVDKECFRTYDTDGEGTYILEDGDYYLSVGNGAHDALNNILDLKGKGTSDGMDYEGDKSLTVTLDLNESDEFSESSVTGNEISNQLASADLSAYGQAVTYLTRNDWSSTMPDGSLSVTATDAMKEELIPETSVEEDSGDEMPETGADNGLTLQMFMETDYDSEAWDDLVAEMTTDELYQLVSDGDFHTYAVESIAAPGTVHKDGPQGIGTTFTGSSGQCMAYPCEPIMAATFNTELMEEVGEMVGEDGLHAGIQGWYAPGANIHRTPYSGRNFEYFSEDPFLSGTVCAAEVKGAQSMGMICYTKHFCFNDQDTARHGVQVWTNEQAAREIYLRSFELPITKSGAMGMMSSYTHIGTQWIGGSYNILTNIVREEWGFEGCIITDFAAAEYMSISEGVTAGNDLWLLAQGNFLGCNANVLEDGWESNATVVSSLQRAAKNVLFTVSRSASMNGLSGSSRVVNVTPAWIYWLIIVNVVIFAALIVGSVFIVRGYVRALKKTQPPTK